MEKPNIVEPWNRSQNQSVFSPLEELNYESNTYVGPGI